MMYPLTVRKKLAGDLRAIDIWCSDWAGTLLRAELLFQLLGERREVPELRPLESMLYSVEALEHACLESLKTGRWRCPIPWDKVKDELRYLGDRSNEFTRESLLAFSALYPDEPRLEGVRTNVMRLMPPILDQVGLGELLFLTSDAPAKLVERCPDVRLGWIHTICRSIVSSRVASLLALTIPYCEKQGLDLVDWVRTGMDEIDADLVGNGTDLRIRTDAVGYGANARDYKMFAARKGRPGLEVVVKVQGTGGALRAGLAALLEETLYELPPRLMNILNGKEPIKLVSRARSKADFLDLLGRSDSVASIRLELSGDVTIDDLALEPYRMRFRTFMECVRARFPNVTATGEIVAVPAH